MSAKDVIIALDFPTREETLTFLDQFPAGEKPFVKIGMELFYAEGPQVVRDIKARGHKIFLDLKLHDIPNTVKKAMSVLRNLDVDITNRQREGRNRKLDLIAPLLEDACIYDKSHRNEVVRQIAAEHGIARRTVLQYLWRYWVSTSFLYSTPSGQNSFISSSILLIIFLRNIPNFGDTLFYCRKYNFRLVSS